MAIFCGSRRRKDHPGGTFFLPLPNIQDANFFDVRANLIFDLVADLGIEQGLTERRMKPHLARFRRILTSDQGEGELLAVGDILDLDLRTQQYGRRGRNPVCCGETIAVGRRIERQARLLRFQQGRRWDGRRRRNL